MWKVIATRSARTSKSIGSTASSKWSTVQWEGTKAARYGMVICWKFRTRERRTLWISGDEAVIRTMVGVSDHICEWLLSVSPTPRYS